MDSTKRDDLSILFLRGRVCTPLTVQCPHTLSILVIARIWHNSFNWKERIWCCFCISVHKPDAMLLGHRKYVPQLSWLLCRVVLLLCHCNNIRTEGVFVVVLAWKSVILFYTVDSCYTPSTLVMTDGVSFMRSLCTAAFKVIIFLEFEVTKVGSVVT